MTGSHRKCISLLLIGMALGCVGRPPLRTYTIARSALDSARKAEGARNAGQQMHKAEEAYRRGEFYFKSKDYSAAAEEFENTIKFAEEAENIARLNPKGE